MSYLELPNGIADFDKAVISLWFRIPLSSMQAAVAQSDADIAAAPPGQYFPPRLSGIVPLITFGKMFEGYSVESTDDPAGTYREIDSLWSSGAWHTTVGGTITYTKTNFHKGAPYPVNPSFIGVNCSTEDDGSFVGDLRIRLQMGDSGAGTSINPLYDFHSTDRTSAQAYGPGPPPPGDWAWSYNLNHCFFDVLSPFGPWQVSHTTSDWTDLLSQQYGPESYNISNIPVTPDHWHHLLISFDLSRTVTGTGIKSISDYNDCAGGGDPPITTHIVYENNVRAVSNANEMWIALDDVNQTNISGWADNLDGIGPNSIAPDNVYTAAFAINSVYLHQKSWPTTGCLQIFSYTDDFDIPTYSYIAKPIPSNGFELGVPAISTLFDRIHPVELAELQFFTDVTLDTSVETNRRAFIDADGKPVPPVPPLIDNPAYNPGLPESPTNPKLIPDPKGGPAEQLLGQTPVILLHGSGNWSAGTNTGPMIDNPDYDPTLPESADNPKLIPDPDLQFTPTGQTVSYTPDPSLYGPQSPEEPQPPPVRLQRRIRVPA
jgi:hypothetical protein